MTNQNLKKFLVLYLVPPAIIEGWAKTNPETRKAAEDKMRGEWGTWMRDHAAMIISTEVGGSTKRISPQGISATKNDILLFSFIEADSHEAAAQAFENHPHLQIPESTIEVMEVKQMGGG